MKLANKITISRLPLTLCFLIFYFFPEISQTLRFDIHDFRWTIPVLWVLMFLLFISDELDGIIARKRNEISEFGARLDLFTDSILRIVYGFCFGLANILLLPLILILLFGDHVNVFIMLLMRQKIPSFIVRAWKPFFSKCYYINYFGYALALLIYSCRVLNVFGEWQNLFYSIANISFGIGSCGLLFYKILLFLRNRKKIMEGS
jgi:phosphatidylglycerophosphate synthase